MEFFYTSTLLFCLLKQTDFKEHRMKRFIYLTFCFCEMYDGYQLHCMQYSKSQNSPKVNKKRFNTFHFFHGAQFHRHRRQQTFIFQLTKCKTFEPNDVYRAHIFIKSKNSQSIL